MSAGAGRIPLRFAAAGLGLLLAIWFLRYALLPFIVAMLLAYLLAPLVTRLGRHMRPGFAAGVALAGTVGSLAALLWILIPWLILQGGRFLESLPHWQAQAQAKLGPWFSAHPWATAKLTGLVEGIEPATLLQGLKITGGGVLGLLLSTLELLLVPVILWFMLLDGRDILTRLLEVAPPRHQSRLQGMVLEVHNRIGGYIRGQLAVALVMTLFHALALTLLGVPWAWLLGLIAGFSNFVPYTPYLTALVPALVLAYLDGGRSGYLGGIALTFTLVQKVEALYLTPVWVGKASGLHPLEVLLALVAFGHWFGLVGLLFAVPLMIVAKVAWHALLTDYRASGWFTQG
ncbi:MAG TPA: AI-2E family transporter [Holophagaceae bacterium]|nr:AI-2E family transporter [Holophagaceae bacterium]